MAVMSTASTHPLPPACDPHPKQSWLRMRWNLLQLGLVHFFLSFSKTLLPYPLALCVGLYLVFTSPKERENRDGALLCLVGPKGPISDPQLARMLS